ncbi:MAG TPA: tetratricopeptide repeat protein [Candidatus Methylacidiphilales bacterium]|nr:tetratricopeptide repeat protein [Candidatus Methylacidiphilales bacterium]
MGIHILMAGEQLGPFSETQVRQYLGEGLVSPSDLATCEGMEEWQALDLLLANLPPSATPLKTVSMNAPSEPPAEEEQAPQPELPFTMHNDTSEETIEPASVAPPAEPAPPLTASQKTKRKLAKIVIQPILPLKATAPARKKNRTGKTALTLGPLRPTTALPPVVGFAPKEKKPTKTLPWPGQLSLRDLSEKPAAPPTATPPALPVTAPAPSNGAQPPPLPAPLENGVESRAAKSWARRIPREIIYVAAGLAFILACLIGSGIYLFSEHHQTPPAANRENAPPAPGHLETQNAAPGAKTAAAYVAQGLAQQARGDLDGAILAYNQALGLDPKQANAFSNRGVAKQSKGDLDGALADYAQALLINPNISADYYNQGLIEVEKGYLDGAISDFNHAIDLDPQNPKMDFAYYHRGVAKDMEGNLDGAIADYTVALTLNPKIALACYKRGFARQSKGDSDGALADYTQALALDPKMADAFCNRGVMKLQKDDLDGAIDDTTQAIDLDPKNGQAYSSRGMARLGKSDLAGAMADLKTFCELAPRDGGADTARIYLWLISTEMNPRDNADEVLSTSLLNDWNSPPEDLTSKIAGFLLGHISESDLIANAASPDPGREPGQYCKVWYFAGMKRLLAGDMTTAISYFEKSLATKQTGLCEYIFARTELQALGQNRAVSSNPESLPSP